MVVRHLEARHFHVLQGRQQHRGIGRLDVLVDLGRGLFEDERPEAGDAADEAGAAVVQRAFAAGLEED
jgi:hypothetical protein